MLLLGDNIQELPFDNDLIPITAKRGVLHQEVVVGPNVCRSFVGDTLEKSTWDSTQSITQVFGSRKKLWPASVVNTLPTVINYVCAMSGPQGKLLMQARIKMLFPDADFVAKGGTMLQPSRSAIRFNHILLGESSRFVFCVCYT